MSQNKQYLTVSDLEECNYNAQYNCVKWIFKDCKMFEDAYIHIKRLNSVGQEIDEIYNIGVNASDLADIFASKYEHRLVERPINLDSPSQDVDRIKRRLHSVVCEYIPKYLKTVETYSYIYNPLANVDSNEQFAYIDKQANVTNSGSATSESENENTSHSETNVNTASTSVAGGTNIATPETSLFETQYDDTGKSDANLKSYTTSSGGTTSTSTANKDDNYSDGSASSTSSASSTNSNTTNYSNINVDIKATDNALGFGMDNATNIHVEKHRRVGNIGVTKTTELIESERNLYKSIIHDFLEDAAKEILLPLFKFD